MVQILEEIIASLQRGTKDGIEAYIKTERRQKQDNGISTQIYIHTIKEDGNRNIRLKDFINFLMVTCTLFVIPRSRIEEARNQDAINKTFDETNRLNDEAKKLFTRSVKTGEVGELILFVLAERLLGFPQILCKLSYKTSSAMHVHGADAVHLGISDKKTPELYWGESKMHANFNSALNGCLKSIKPKLIGEGVNLNEDLLLVQNYLKLDDGKCTNAIKTILDKNKPAYNEVAFCGICFIGFDDENYYTNTSTEIIDAQKEKWEVAIHKKINELGITNFKIHFFCFPFTSIKEVQELFLKRLGN